MIRRVFFGLSGVLVAGWVLTLGFFVEISLDTQYRHEKRVNEEIRVATAVVRGGKVIKGIPFLYHVTRDIGPYGLAFRITSPKPLSRVEITRITVDGSTIPFDTESLKDYEGRNYFGLVPHVLSDNKAASVRIVGAITQGGERRDFTTEHDVEINLVRRSCIGWLMLVYFSRF